jgi:NTP pyrophosphatase (non-canonical NTP hydrolase)
MKIERMTQAAFMALPSPKSLARRSSQISTPWADVRTKCREHLDGCPGAPYGVERMNYLVLAMAGAAGEAANIAKKLWRGDRKVTVRHLIKEVADTANYACVLAEHLGIDLLSEQMKDFVEYERKQKNGSRP